MTLDELVNAVMTKLDNVFPNNDSLIPFSLTWERDVDLKRYAWVAYIEIHDPDTDFERDIRTVSTEGPEQAIERVISTLKRAISEA